MTWLFGISLPWWLWLAIGWLAPTIFIVAVLAAAALVQHLRWRRRDRLARARRRAIFHEYAQEYVREARR